MSDQDENGVAEQLGTLLRQVTSAEELLRRSREAAEALPDPPARPWWLVPHLQRAEYFARVTQEYLRQCLVGTQNDDPMRIPD